MAERQVEILRTGVPGLDQVLGGGLPELSFNLIAGGPGTGKTTLAMQMLFANATARQPGMFLTLLGEPTLKLLRYQQEFEFFDTRRVGSEVHVMNLSEQVLSRDLDQVLERIVAEVDHLRPGVVAIDSFRTLTRPGSEQPGLALEHFVQRLALHLTTWDVTSFLIGEYVDQELRNPVFTVADGIIWLSQAVDRNSVVRKLQVMKMRGMAPMPGLHTSRITRKGVQVFPRIPERTDGARARGGGGGGVRLSTGIAGLDEMLGGGIQRGDSVVLAGPTGSGKTSFAAQFVAAGLRAGETGVIAVFEEHPEQYLTRASTLGLDLREAVRENKLRVIYLRPLDLSVDETLQEIREAVEQVGATRVVIDSISGFEMALAPTFREDFRESLYRLVGTLTGLGVTIFSTVEVVECQTGSVFTGYRVSFLTDVILSQRYVEIEGELRKVLLVVKARGSAHSAEFRAYEITGSGVVLGESLREYDGISTGVPARRPRPDGA
jgi:circadian clock protein KaiC